MDPASTIAALDRSLAIAGEPATLRRTVGSANQADFDVAVTAHVRGYKGDELTGAIEQHDLKVIISPTEIIAAGWPGPSSVHASEAGIDKRVPKRGDTVIIAGRTYNVESAAPMRMAGTLVRIELQVRG